MIAAARKTCAALWAATAVSAAGAAAADVAVLDVGAPHERPQATIATAIGLLAGRPRSHRQSRPGHTQLAV